MKNFQQKILCPLNFRRVVTQRFFCARSRIYYSYKFSATDPGVLHFKKLKAKFSHCCWNWIRSVPDLCSDVLCCRDGRYICNLAVADTVVCLLAAPLTPLTAFSGAWHFGWLLCKLLPLAQGMSIYMSTLSLTATALDRYITVTRLPTSRPAAPAGPNIAAINLVATAAVVPYCLHMEWAEEGAGQSCTERWQADTARRLYGVFVFTTQAPHIVSDTQQLKHCFKQG